MAITTYSELQAAIADWLDDDTMTSSAETFIALAEAYFRRVVNTDRTIDALSSGNPSNWLLESHPDLYLYASLAQAEFRGWNDERLPMIKQLVDQLLADVNAAELRRRRAAAAQITNYASLQAAVELNLQDQSLADGVTTYIQLADQYLARVINTDQALTALSNSNTSNWLLASHADLYLYASLIHAEAYGWRDERLPMLRQLVEGMVEQVNTAELRRRRAASSAITSYATLQAEIGNFLADESLAEGAVLFITLAESQFSREINTDQAWTALSGSNTSNWILADYPDLYLYASLAHAEAWGWNDARLPAIRALVREMIEAVNTAELRRRRAASTAVTSYTTLKAELENYLADNSIAAGIPLFITLAEAHFRREINTDQSWTALSGGNPSNWILASYPDLYLYASLIHAEAWGWNDARLPAIKEAVGEMIAGVNTAELRRRRADSVPITSYTTLKSAIEDNLRDESLAASIPLFITLAEAQFGRELNTDQAFTALSGGNPSNWILASHPDLYLYASLVHAEAWGWNDARLPAMKEAVSQMIAAVNVAEKRRRLASAVQITNYATLQTAIRNWLNDESLSESAPLFIQLAEQYFARRINTDQAWTALSGSNTSNWLLASHADLYLYASLIHAEAYGWQDERIPALKALVDELIENVNIAELRRRRSDAAPITNFTTLKAAIEDNLQDESLFPSAALFIQMAEALFTRRINTDQAWTALSAENPTNWILNSHPDLYLYASLIHAEARGWRDERLPLLKQRVEEMLDELNVRELRRRRADQAAITNYATLKDVVLDNLADYSLNAMVPTYVALAESKLARLLRTLDAEVVATATAAAQLDLPSGYKGVRTVYLDDFGPLEQLSPDDFQALYADDASTGVPRHYAIWAGSLNFGPPPDGDYTVRLTYFLTLTPLSNSDPVNWLLESHPDAYFSATMAEAELARGNLAQAAGWEERLAKTMAEINKDDARTRRGDLVSAVACEYF